MKIPCLAVITPTESILVTSSYVSTPPTETLPLKFAPTAALSAIVAASLFVDETGVPFEGSPSKIYTAFIACCIALLTRSILFTIVVGLTALWALS